MKLFYLYLLTLHIKLYYYVLNSSLGFITLFTFLPFESDFKVIIKLFKKNHFHWLQINSKTSKGITKGGSRVRVLVKTIYYII